MGCPSQALLSLITDLNDYSLRNTDISEVDALMKRLDSYRLSLKTDIQNLTSLLSPLIEGCCLLDQKLKLEILSKSQITSGEHETRSLKELFEFTDDCSYFLTEEAFLMSLSLTPKLQLSLW